jgi:hypothetical protein
MAFHKLALRSYLLIVDAAVPTTQAFVVPTSIKSRFAATTTDRTTSCRNGSSVHLKMVATTPSDLGINTNENIGNLFGGQNDNKDENNGAMIDLKGIAFSVSQRMIDCWNLL